MRSGRLQAVKRPVVRNGKTFMWTVWIDPTKEAGKQRGGSAKPVAAEPRPAAIEERFLAAGEWGKKKGWQTNDLDEIYRLAEEARPEFLGIVQGLQKQFGGEVMSRSSLKKRARVQEKAEEEAREAGKDEPQYNQITDIDGHTIILDSPEDVVKLYESLKGQKWVVRTKNRFANPLPTGYRDMFINVELSNGAIGELQISTKAMMAAKDGPGHKIYEAYRTLVGGFDARPPRPPRTEKTERLAVALEELQSKVYSSAYAASVSRARFDAWSSVRGSAWNHMARALQPVESVLPETILTAVQGVAEKSNLTIRSSKSPKTIRPLGKSLMPSSIHRPRLVVKLNPDSHRELTGAMRMKADVIAMNKLIREGVSLEDI